MKKQELGLSDTKAFVGRARVCTGCHIGDANRDVNHDLIAAGHPRLDFEFSAYMANYPPHWKVSDDHARALAGTTASAAPTTRSTLDAQLWFVGQVVSVEAALNLTKFRAESPSAPWPELAEYSCFSCHHDLQAESWRQRGRGARSLETIATAWDRDPPGAFAWNSWLMAFAGDVAPADERWLPKLKAARSLVRQPGEDRKAVAQAVTETLTVLRESAVIPHGLDAADLKRLIDQATGTHSPIDQHWEGAAQAYLAVCSASVALAGLPDAAASGIDLVALRTELELLQDLLVFPQRIRSPAIDTPRVQQVRAGFDRIRTLAGLPPIGTEP